MPEEHKTLIDNKEEKKNQMQIPVVVLRNDDENVNWKIRELNELLFERGFNISLEACSNQNLKTGKRYLLSITVDWGIIGRGAGRKNKPTDITLNDIREMEKQGLHSKEIADKAGLSIASYYRRKAIAIKKELTCADGTEIFL